MKLSAGDLELDVRAGTVADVPVLVSFIHAMAEYEKVPVSVTEDDLRRSLFGERPAASTLLAFLDGRPVAYAIWFFTFSSMLGRRGFWLEDVFVSAELRGRGIGRALMKHLAGIAAESGCARFEWTVLGWNEPAIGFYRGLGARFMDEWRTCRLEGEAIARLARS